MANPSCAVQLSSSVRLLEILGVTKLLDPEREFSNTDELLVPMAEMVKQNAWSILTLLGLTVNHLDTPIAIAQMILSKLGLKLRYLGRFGSRGHRQRVYGGASVSDGRGEIFRRWLERDAAAAAAA